MRALRLLAERLRLAEAPSPREEVQLPEEPRAPVAWPALVERPVAAPLQAARRALEEALVEQ